MCRGAGRTVTELRPSKQRRGVYVVCLDHDSAFLCPDDVAARWGLRSGLQLDPETAEQLVWEAEVGLATGLALELVALAPRSEQQLVDTLRRRAVRPEAARQAARRLLELGYIDDTAFAQALVAKLRRQGNLGELRIQSELIRRGVDRDLVCTIMGCSEESGERERALALARKRMATWKEMDQAAGRRLAGYLQRRGFGWDTIRWCLQQLAPEVDMSH